MNGGTGTPRPLRRFWVRLWRPWMPWPDPLFPMSREEIPPADIVRATQLARERRWKDFG